MGVKGGEANEGPLLSREVPKNKQRWGRWKSEGVPDQMPGKKQGNRELQSPCPAIITALRPAQSGDDITGSPMLFSFPPTPNTEVCSSEPAMVLLSSYYIQSYILDTTMLH